MRNSTPVAAGELLRILGIGLSILVAIGVVAKLRDMADLRRAPAA